MAAHLLSTTAAGGLTWSGRLLSGCLLLTAGETVGAKAAEGGGARPALLTMT